jgi:hypothetical protein
MPDVLSLYAFEDQFHAAVVARLKAAGVEDAFPALDLGADAPAARIVVEATGFARASGHMGAGPAGELRYDHFGGQVNITIITPRRDDGPATHARWLGLVRELFLPSRRPLAGMPYQIMRFEESGGSVTRVQDGERDRSELVFEAEIGLRAGV